jgi:hypothetical protein
MTDSASEVERYYYERISDDLDPSPSFKEGWLVAATDYDALAARLAEAERLLREWVDSDVNYRSVDESVFKASLAFLRAAHSAKDRA